MYRNALVATDGSAIATSVFAHVPQVVDPDGRVVVVQVIDDVSHVLTLTTPAGFPVGGSATYSLEIAESIVDSQRAEAETHLAEAKRALEAAGMRNVETAILSGVPGNAIVEAAREHGHDVVLMGTHGRSGFRRAVLGSVAEHVLRHLDNVPVVLVRASEAED